MIRQLALAVAFLTRLPIPVHHSTGQDSDMLQALKWAPIVGIMIGLLQTLAAAVLMALQLPALVIGLVVVGLAVWLTRGLHEDGLSDYADGLGGGWSVERRLEIMRDSRIGAFGTIALTLSLGLRAALVASLANASIFHLGLALLLAGSLSRSSFLVLFKLIGPARKDGLSSGIAKPTNASLLIALTPPVLLTFALYPPVGLLVLALWAGTLLMLVKQANLALGGHTGDVAGAAQQSGEMAVLFVLAMGIWR